MGTQCVTGQEMVGDESPRTTKLYDPYWLAAITLDESG